MQCSPLKPGCLMNFTDLDRLPYCAQYTGAAPPPEQHTCRNFDAIELGDYSRTPVPNSLFIPTRISSLPQYRDCDREAVHCPDAWKMSAEKTSYFVGNLEKFTLLLDHTFFVNDEHRSIYRSGFAGTHQGYWEVCTNANVRADCGMMKIPCANDETCDMIEGDVPGIDIDLGLEEA